MGTINKNEFEYDAVVIGSGHAGSEACLALARLKIGRAHV